MDLDQKFAEIVFEHTLEKLRREKIYNKRRKTSFEYSLKSSEEIQASVSKQIGVKKKDIYPYQSGESNFIVDGRLDERFDQPPKPPTLDTELVGANFPIGRAGFVYVSFPDGLDVTYGPNVTERHVTKIQKIEAELKKEADSMMKEAKKRLES